MVQAAISIPKAVSDRKRFMTQAASDGPVRHFELRTLPISALRPNPFQARRNFNEERLKRLAESLRMHGPLQPIVVRPLSEPAAEAPDASKSAQPDGGGALRGHGNAQS